MLALVVAGALGALALAGRPPAPPSQPVANHAFRSTPGSGPANVWALGDGADGGPAARALARTVARAHPHRLLYLGDVYPAGSREDFAHGFEPVYGALAARIAPTPGNHEWPAHDVGYDPYWRQVTGAATPPWYAFRAGGWTVLSLNSEAPHAEGSPQVRWLRAQLRGRSTCRLAFWHRPRYSAGSHGDQSDVAPLWNPLRGHAVLVIAGHSHDLQRMRPRDGLTELVAGAGGHGQSVIDRTYPGLAFGDDQHHGALRLRLRPGRAAAAFVTTGGRVLDRVRVPCRGP